MDIQRVSVIGAGQMGSGIAQVAAQSGLHVTLVDVDEARVNKGLQTIEKNLGRQQEKGRLTEEQKGRSWGACIR